MATLVLLFASLMQAPPAIPKRLDNLTLNAPEFKRSLTEVLSKVKLGMVPSLDPRTNRMEGPMVPAAFSEIDPSKQISLPGALCRISEIQYSCVWETVPNKYSVAVLFDRIVENVSATVPQSWSREHGQTLSQRWAEFLDPNREVVISVNCPVANRDPVVLTSYTATLTIHRKELRVN